MNNKFYERIVYIIFFFSGISGLVYETVWLRVLSRILGSTVYATSIVLSAFMLGLALGSYFIGRRADKFKKIIRVYAILEIFVGISALLVFFALNQSAGVFKSIYLGIDEQKKWYLFIQALLVFIALVIPTFLMGGTLPILGAAIKKYKGSFVRNMGNLYGINTFGAVFGVLISGFITIGFIGELNTVYLGVVINIAVGLVALTVLKQRETGFYDESNAELDKQKVLNEKISNYSLSIRRILLIGYALIGFTSFALEVVWTRIFQLQLGTSIYSFSMVLGIYLLGSAIGSLIAGKYYYLIKDPVKTMGYFIVFIGLYTIAGLYLFTFFTPGAMAESMGISRFMVPLLIVFPVTFTLGLIFPVVSNCYVESRSKIGKGIGFLYSMNTLGCILGALVAGYILIRFIGTRNTMILISVMNGIMGLVILIVGLEKVKKPSNSIIATTLTAIILIAGILSPDPFFSVVKRVVNRTENAEIYYHKEGISATVTAYGSKTDSLDKHILINGMGMTSLVPETKIMAHLPILLNGETKDVLIICFGMGTRLKSALAHKDVNCEIVELVGEEYETYDFFHKNGSEILKNPRVQYHVDDGRNFLLLRDKKYDVITIDPSPPLWSAGTVNLYTSDFFQLCKDHLTDNGILCMWLPPCQYTELKMIMNTYYQVFPDATVYGGFNCPGFFMMGSRNPLNINIEIFKEAASDKKIMNDLNEWGHLFDSPEELLELKIADAKEMKDFLKGEKVITDNYPYTEFPAWRKAYHPKFNYWFTSFELTKILSGEIEMQ